MAGHLPGAGRNATKISRHPAATQPGAGKGIPKKQPKISLVRSIQMDNSAETDHQNL